MITNKDSIRNSIQRISANPAGKTENTSIRRFIVLVMALCASASLACAEENKDTLKDRIEQWRKDAEEWASDRLEDAKEIANEKVEDAKKTVDEKIEDASKWIDEMIYAPARTPADEAAAFITAATEPAKETSASMPTGKPDSGSNSRPPDYTGTILSIILIGIPLALIGMVKRSDKAEKGNRFDK